MSFEPQNVTGRGVKFQFREMERQLSGDDEVALIAGSGFFALVDLLDVGSHAIEDRFDETFHFLGRALGGRLRTNPPTSKLIAILRAVYRKPTP
jgi:hypothetical protein